MKKNQNSFVLFRLPNQNKVEFWQLSEFEKSDSKFIFHSFDNKEHIELFSNHKLSLDLNKIDGLDLDFDFKSDNDIPNSINKDEYLEKANDFIDKLKQNDFEKIILSRVKLESGIEDIKSKFKYLCDKFPTAWVYFFHHKQENWLGASPERLLQSTKDGYKTVALAGTKSKADNRDWTEKEYKEHDFVVQYILSKFEDNSIQKNGPYTIDLGNIQHLKTDIDITDKSLSLYDILNKLHPTPAVCGIPKDKAMEYIKKNEGYDRSFYTGYFGIETPEHTEFNVNLRCAQLFKNKTAIYVGGGLVAESNPESEWNETELKSKALF